MKKVSLFLGMVLAASFAMAQNTATLSQTGLGNDASIAQTGSNSAVVLQEALPGATNNNATVTQNGAGNTVYASQHQQANLASPQNVFVTQIGNSNSATQLQGFGYTGYNSATISQLTSNNTGFQRQDGYNMTASISQSGDNWNNAQQFQSGSHLNSSLIQTGYNNISVQIQSGINQLANITSVGDRNKAYQTQSGGGYSDNLGNPQGGHVAIIYQNGSDNTATQTQEGWKGNYTSLFQNGSWNNSTQTVNGTFNIAKLYQTNGGTAYSSQSGDENKIKGLTAVGNYDATWAKFSGSQLIITQTGIKNSLALEADGAVTVTQNNDILPNVLKEGNKIEFSQAGSGTSILSQTGGDANLVKFTKTGGGSAYVAQTGNTNKLAQFDDVFGAAAVTEAALFNGADLDLIQTGDGNLLNLNSTSAGAVVNVSQIGNTNRASITQN